MSTALRMNSLYVCCFFFQWLESILRNRSIHIYNYPLNHLIWRTCFPTARLASLFSGSKVPISSLYFQKFFADKVYQIKPAWRYSPEFSSTARLASLGQGCHCLFGSSIQRSFSSQQVLVQSLILSWLICLGIVFFRNFWRYSFHIHLATSIRCSNSVLSCNRI